MATGSWCQQPKCRCQGLTLNHVSRPGNYIIAGRIVRLVVLMNVIAEVVDGIELFVTLRTGIVMQSDVLGDAGR